MSEDLPDRFDPDARDQLARAHWPEGMGWSADDDALLARGWPHMVVLVDGHPHDRKPADSAWKVLAAIDPVYGPRWPKETARRFLLGMAAAKGRERGAYEAAIGSDEAPTAETLDAVVRSSLGTDRYPFHVREAAFIAEAFLGPAVVGERIVAALEGLSAQDWSFASMHLRFLECLFVLECCLLRAERDVAQGLFDRVAAVWRGRPPEAPYSTVAHRIQLMVEGTTGADTRIPGLYDMPLLTTDAAFVQHRLTHQFVGWLVDPQHLRLLGPDVAPPRAFGGLRRDPAWKQQRDVEVYGLIRHPVAVRWMLGLLGSRGAKALPEQWLIEHLEFARPMVERLRDQGSPHTQSIEAVLAGDVAAAKKAKSAKPPKAAEVRKRVAEIFDALIGALRADRGDAEAERSAIHTAANALIELKAASGDPIPEAHIGHILGVDGWDPRPAPLLALDPDPEELQRWFDSVDSLE